MIHPRLKAHFSRLICFCMEKFSCHVNTCEHKNILKESHIMSSEIKFLHQSVFIYIADHVGWLGRRIVKKHLPGGDWSIFYLSDSRVFPEFLHFWANSRVALGLEQIFLTSGFFKGSRVVCGNHEDNRMCSICSTLPAAAEYKFQHIKPYGLLNG